MLLVLSLRRAWAAEPSASDLEPFVVALTLNGVDLGSVLVLRGAGGTFYFREVDLAQWGTCHGDDPSVQFRGNSFHGLTREGQSSLHFDPALQTLELKLPATCFDSTHISVARPASAPTPASPGLFFNYDFFASGQHGPQQSQDTMSGLLEGVVFNRLGTLAVDVLDPNIASRDRYSQTASRNTLLRLDTTYTRDDVGHMTRLELGDTLSGSGIWGRPVRFAGVRFSRNFQTHPGFVTQPLPSVAGQAEVPSTVEVYLNGILQTRQQVQPGPFQITDLQSFGSGGNIQLVVRDLQGREVVTNLPFVTGVSLLRQGLTDFSVESGSLRKDYGIRSFAYDEAFFSATVRHGFTDSMTLEGRTEVYERSRTAGIGANVVVPFIQYVLTSAVVGSHSPSGGGDQETLSLHPGLARAVSLNASLQRTSAHFVQLGAAPGRPPPRYTAAWSLSVSSTANFFVTASQVRSAPRDRPVSVIDSLSMNWRPGRAGSLSLSAFRTQAGPRNEGILLTFSSNLGARDSFIATGSLQRGSDGRTQTQLQSEYDHLPASELGSGWDVRLIRDGSLDSDRSVAVGAGGIFRGRTLSLTAQVDRGVDRTDYQGDVSGGFGAIGGVGFASRRIFDSVGVAVAPGLPNLPVYVENQLAGVTDARGRVLLPRLIEYSDNKISIDSTDLPFDAELIGPDSVSVAPYYRSGVVVELPVRRFRSAVVILRQESGEPVPTGAQVDNLAAEGSPASSSFAADHGEIYVRNVVEHGNHLRLQWENHRCDVTFDVPTGDRLQPRIGPLTCVALQ